MKRKGDSHRLKIQLCRRSILADDQTWTRNDPIENQQLGIPPRTSIIFLTGGDPGFPTQLISNPCVRRHGICTEALE